MFALATLGRFFFSFCRAGHLLFKIGILNSIAWWGLGNQVNWSFYLLLYLNRFELNTWGQIVAWLLFHIFVLVCMSVCALVCVGCMCSLGEVCTCLLLACNFYGKKQKCRGRRRSCALPTIFESITKLTFWKSVAAQPIKCLHVAELVNFKGAFRNAHPNESDKHDVTSCNLGN